MNLAIILLYESNIKLLCKYWSLQTYITVALSSYQIRFLHWTAVEIHNSLKWRQNVTVNNWTLNKTSLLICTLKAQRILLKSGQKIFKVRGVEDSSGFDINNARSKSLQLWLSVQDPRVNSFPSSLWKREGFLKP